MNHANLRDAVKIYRRPEFALVVILGWYFIFGLWHVLLTPIFEKPDEEWHAAYVAFLADRGQLPPLIIDPEVNPAYQIAGHPPLFYALSALAVRGLRLELTLPALEPNPFWAYPAPGAVPDNKNRFLHASGEVEQLHLGPLYLLRGLSLVLGAGTVLAAYGIGRALTGKTSLALMSAAVAAILPQYTFIASSVSNDSLVASLSSLALLVLILALEDGRGWRYWILFGLAAGLAALTKTSAVVLPLFGVAVALAAAILRRSPRLAVRGVAASLGLWFVIAGWWYLRNAALYGDPWGVGVHVTQYGRPAAVHAWNLVDSWTQTSVTFWAAFGWNNVQLPAWIYLVLRCFEILAAVGLGWLLVRDRRQLPHRMAWGVVIGYTILMLTAYLWWTSQVTGALGRLLFPALAPLAFLFCAGLRQWSPKLLAAAWAVIAASALLTPAFIQAAYQPPAAASGAANLRPVGIAVGAVAQLTAAGVDPHRVTPGESVEVTLCWQPIQTTDENYVLFVQLVADGDRKIGERNTYPGLGRFPTSQWQPGQPFCDQIDLPVEGTAPTNAIYSVIAGLHDLASGQNLPLTSVDGQPIEQLVLDQIKVTGPSALLPSSALALDASFGDQIGLIGYEFGAVDADNRTTLTLYWQARAPIQRNYAVFVHLLDSAGQLLTQADGQPQQGRYPTHWWDVDEIVVDQHSLELPGDLAAGSYSVLVGLYAPETGERLLLNQGPRDSLELPQLPTIP